MMMTQGYIKSSSPGIFSLMPLALRSLEKMCLLIDEVMETVHAQRVLFPTLIQDSLLKTTGIVIFLLYHQFVKTVIIYASEQLFFNFLFTQIFID